MGVAPLGLMIARFCPRLIDGLVLMALIIRYLGLAWFLSDTAAGVTIVLGAVVLVVALAAAAIGGGRVLCERRQVAEIGSAKSSGMGRR